MTEQRTPAPLTPEDERLTLEGETLAVVSSFGGERIIASPRMEAMVAQLADLTERTVARRVDAERAGAGRLREAAQAVANESPSNRGFIVKWQALRAALDAEPGQPT